MTIVQCDPVIKIGLFSTSIYRLWFQFSSLANVWEHDHYDVWLDEGRTVNHRHDFWPWITLKTKFEARCFSRSGQGFNLCWGGLILPSCSYCRLRTYTWATWRHITTAYITRVWYYFGTARADDGLALRAINTRWWLLYSHPLSGGVAYSNRFYRATATSRLCSASVSRVVVSVSMFLVSVSIVRDHSQWDQMDTIARNASSF